MKHLIYILLTPILIFSQLTKSEKEICQAVKNVKIVVNSDFEDIGSVDEPFESEAKRILRFAKLSVISEDTASYDAIITINVRGRALSKRYYTSQSKRSFYNGYTGASVKGNTFYEIANILYYDEDIGGTYRSDSYTITKRETYKKNAPYLMASKLDKALLKMLGMIYGGEPIIQAVIHGNNWHQREAAKLLGEIKDPRAIKPLIDGLDDRWVRKQFRKALQKITGKNYGNNQEKWLKWWEENNNKY